MKKITFLLLACMISCVSFVSAKEILDVEPGTGTLNAAIKQYKGDRIYRLQDGYNGYYALDEIITNEDFELTIIGGGTPDADDPHPEIPATLQTSGTGGVPFSYMFQVFSNITLQGIYFVNASTDGVFNTQFFMCIEGNNVRVNIDNCVLDPAGNPIHSPGGSPKIYLTNNLFNRITAQNASVNGPVNFFFPNQEFGVDTLYVENNTFVGLSTSVFSDNCAPVKSNFTLINHNTFIHHMSQIDWMSNQEKFFFTNNLLYDCHVIPYEKAWVGGWDNYPAGSVSELLWSHPSAQVKENGVMIDWGFDKMTSYVGYNIEFKNEAFLDNLDNLKAWCAAEGKPNTFYFQPLVWTDDAPARGIELSEALDKNPQAKIYNSGDHPTWKAVSNKYDINPNFTDSRIKEHSDIMAKWVVPAMKKDYFSTTGEDFTQYNWYWDPDGNAGQNETWPLFDGSYTNETAKTFSIESLPAGDLNWFPEAKAQWLKNKEAIEDHMINQLRTDKIDITDGVESNKIQQKVNIYPNPVQGSFRIDGVVDGAVTVYDATGRLVKSVQQYEGSVSVDNLVQGLYFVKFESNGIHITQKFIKK